ncbi:reverse transcriptase domain-containing protein [Tanacetum coccineum]|uniref:Reverse transcriptase domain-containing protein n=1 Tax=Tanacetum coccineum TaxID=301880 RepID=A0ABQ5FD45_9ASTR
MQHQSHVTGPYSETHATNDKLEVAIPPDTRPKQEVSIEGSLSDTGTSLCAHSCKRNLDIFAWEPKHMTRATNTEDELVRDIVETFRALRKINMKLNPKKCTFGATEGMFLGYLIEPDGIKPLKGQILADFFIEKPETDAVLPQSEVKLQEPWILFTDGSSCVDGSGAGLILTNPEGMEFTYALRFEFTATNNEAEYEALIAGLRIAARMGTTYEMDEGESGSPQSAGIQIGMTQKAGTKVGKEPYSYKHLEKSIQAADMEGGVAAHVEYLQSQEMLSLGKCSLVHSRHAKELCTEPSNGGCRCTQHRIILPPFPPLLTKPYAWGPQKTPSTNILPKVQKDKGFTQTGKEKNLQ